MQKGRAFFFSFLFWYLCITTVTTDGLFSNHYLGFCNQNLDPFRIKRDYLNAAWWVETVSKSPTWHCSRKKNENRFMSGTNIAFCSFLYKDLGTALWGSKELTSRVLFLYSSLGFYSDPGSTLLECWCHGDASNYFWNWCMSSLQLSLLPHLHISNVYQRNTARKKRKGNHCVTVCNGLSKCRFPMATNSIKVHMGTSAEDLN